MAMSLGAGSGLIHLSLSNVEALQKNRIGQQGGKTIADYLRKSLNHTDLVKLQILNLSGTNLGSKGAEHIFHAMRDTIKSLHLMDLDVSRNEIDFGPEHIDPLSQVISNRESTFENLNISFNSLGDEMLAKLMPHIISRVTLQQLYLDGCSLTLKGVTSFFRYLRSNYSVQIASIACNDLSYPDPDDINNILTS